jgi:D-aspartate ligase
MNEVQKGNPAPVLLFNADYNGTLAAVRCFGRLGIPITIADPKVFVAAKWSKYVSRRVRAPSTNDINTFLNWLLEFGQQNRGHVLYPTSDEMAWLLAFHKDSLSDYYQLYSPSIDCIYQILNKELLYTACRDLQIAVPETYFPKSEAELQEVSHLLSYPVMIKPQTQVFFERHIKGSQAQTREELLDTYSAFMQWNRYSDEFLSLYSTIQWPMLQHFYPEAADHIYNLSGFIDASGELFALRASRKVLQKPRQLGIGLCFEEEEIKPTLAEKLIHLCKAIGYYGVFEVEFIQRNGDGQYLLTDFNPRFYSQMAFDNTLGLPLPAIVYYAAVSDIDKLRATIKESKSRNASMHEVYCHKHHLLLMINAQRIFGKSCFSNQWKHWLTAHKDSMTDAVADPSDRLPALVDDLSTFLDYFRHPRKIYGLL